ncbi:unnamed protein product [Spodoptera exigua]|nr:unnamed protein product [Spodoptera exigua]
MVVRSLRRPLLRHKGADSKLGKNQVQCDRKLCFHSREIVFNFWLDYQFMAIVKPCKSGKSPNELTDYLMYMFFCVGKSFKPVSGSTDRMQSTPSTATCKIVKKVQPVDVNSSVIYHERQQTRPLYPMAAGDSDNDVIPRSPIEHFRGPSIARIVLLGT